MADRTSTDLSPTTSAALPSPLQRTNWRPAAPLAAHVDRYSWWSEFAPTCLSRRELASTRGVFIINLGQPLEIVDARGSAHRILAGDGVLGGVSRATSLSRAVGEMEGLHVHMCLISLGRLFGLPMAELIDRVVRLSDLPETGASDLGHRLLGTKSPEQKRALLDEALVKRLVNAPASDPLREVLTALSRRRAVGAIAAELGWSRKRLARRLRDTTGLLPREYLSLLRFERFADLLQTRPHLSLAEMAAHAGYADQPHLARAVSRFARTTPSDLRARLLPGGGFRD